MRPEIAIAAVEEARNIQHQITETNKHLHSLIRERDKAFLQLSRIGYTPRQIGKIVGLNYSVIYKVLNRAGYTPAFSFKQGRIRNLTQQAIVEDIKAKMATGGK